MTPLWTPGPGNSTREYRKLASCGVAFWMRQPKSIPAGAVLCRALDPNSTGPLMITPRPEALMMSVRPTTCTYFKFVKIHYRPGQW